MLKIRKVLYPTDFSRCSKQALGRAVELAERHGAELHMLHAVILHGDDPNNPERQFPGSEELFRQLYAIAEAEMPGMVDDERRKALTIREFRTRGIFAGRVILDHAAENEIDVIVMGTHGWRSGPFLGSVAENVVREAPCPVMTLRESDEPEPIEGFGRILVPLDLSDQSRPGLAYAAELADAYGAAMTLLHVVERPVWPSVYGLVDVWREQNLSEKLERRARQGLEELAASLAGREPEIVVVEGAPAAGITDFAAEHGVDLVVISTHGLTGLERLLLGSTAERVVRDASCPVFIVRSFGRSLLA